jgi:hypothetical protein
MTRSLIAVFLLIACGGSTTPAPTPPTPAAAAPAAPAAETFVVQSITHGDHACYLDLQKADGTSAVYPSDYRFCPGGDADAAALVGRKVTATFEKTTIAADSCQGDPECAETKEVEGVATLGAAD